MNFYHSLLIVKDLKDTKGILRSRKSKKDRRYNGQGKRDRQWCTKHYTDN